MIRIKDINKTFNKGKTNEIKAIQQTSITFPEKGLVILVGSSGSGKTTLLNVLGGLEYIDSGEIIIENEIIKKHSSRKLDKIRNEKIGYIFQNYNLLSNLTVYENIEIVLKMIGITDKDEIDKRVNYVLDAVGILNYRKRKVTTLSGGQQQRVGIARAIAKNPEIIIADEPTGNLDSKNTVEIMNIIKKISEQRLVILVTHEKEMAEFYGDRIIEIKDGIVINDYINDHQNELDIKFNNTIYLKDLDKKTLSESPIDIEHYSHDDEVKKNVKIRLITYKDSLYIKVDNGKDLKVRYVDEDSEVDIKDEHFKGLEKEDVKQVDFDFEKMESNKKIKNKKGSVIKTGDAFKSSIKKIFGYSKLQKLMFLGFVFAAMTIAVAIALIGKVYHADPIEFQEVDKHYLLTDTKDLKSLTEQPDIKSINPLFEPQGFSLNIKSFYQINDYLGLVAHPSSYELLKKEDVIFGQYPSNDREVVIDKRVAKNLINNRVYKQAGVTEYEDLLGQNIINDNTGYAIPLKITGISDVESPTIWMDDDYIYELAVNNLRKDLPKISTWDPRDMKVEDGGRLPKKSGEVLYPEKYRELNGYELNGKIESEELDHSYTIVGFYTSENETINSTNEEVVVSTEKLVKENYYNYYKKNNPVLLYSRDFDTTIDALNKNGIEVVKTFEKSLNQYKKDVRKGYYTILIFAAFLLGISLVQLYFIIRSSLINRIYEIGVYRSLGATRWDIHKMFIIEIFVVTTFTSLIGYSIITIVIKEIEKSVPAPFTFFYFPTHYIIGGLLLIYVINTVSGLLPVYRLTRKSPSQILKHYDA